jgi:hypothetical protein
MEVGYGGANRKVKAAWISDFQIELDRLSWRQFWPGGMVLGEPWDGGYYGGDISLDQTGVATHHLIVAPRSRVAVLPWKTNDNNDPGLGYSRIDGPGICAAVGSSSTYPAMAYCNDLSVNGFSDWYLPAQAELEVVSRNLSPFTSTTNNGNIPAEVQTFGWNPWGVTGKTGPYADPHPRCENARWWGKQGPQYLLNNYWSSTQCGGPAWPNYGEFLSYPEPGMAWSKRIQLNAEFPYLSDEYEYKSNENHVWPIRRIPVGTGSGGPLAVP